MSATFLELHKATKRIINVLEPLSPEDRQKVLAAVQELLGRQPAA
jgi:hypothetical protein